MQNTTDTTDTNKTTTLPAGTVVKIDGIPVELTEETRVLSGTPIVPRPPLVIHQ